MTEARLAQTAKGVNGHGEIQFFEGLQRRTETEDRRPETANRRKEDTPTEQWTCTECTLTTTSNGPIKVCPSCGEKNPDHDVHAAFHAPLPDDAHKPLPHTPNKKPLGWSHEYKVTGWSMGYTPYGRKLRMHLDYCWYIVVSDPMRGVLMRLYGRNLEDITGNMLMLKVGRATRGKHPHWWEFKKVTTH